MPIGLLAAQDAVDRDLRLRVAAKRIGTEAGDDRIALVAVPIEHAVGPARSTVATSLTMRIRTMPIGAGDSAPRCTRNLPNSPRCTCPIRPLPHQ